MDTNCKEIWPALVMLAEGKDSPTAKTHVETCPNCRKELQSLTLIFAGLSAGHFEPPQEVVDLAKAIMPPRRVSVARLVSNSLVAGGARGAQDFQLAFEGEDMRARLHYEQIQKGWSVTGRVQSGIPFTLSAAGLVLETDEAGRFAFTAPDLSETAVELRREAGWIQIPSASEITHGGPRSTS
jgi:hypothetical protein